MAGCISSGSDEPSVGFRGFLLISVSPYKTVNDKDKILFFGKLFLNARSHIHKGGVEELGQRQGFIRSLLDFGNSIGGDSGSLAGGFLTGAAGFLSRFAGISGGFISQPDAIVNLVKNLGEGLSHNFLGFHFRYHNISLSSMP
jgi:hypothetical protein